MWRHQATRSEQENVLPIYENVHIIFALISEEALAVWPNECRLFLLAFVAKMISRDETQLLKVAL